MIRASAHGRVNLIGEHTDYNGGFVLPSAIPQQTCVELTPRSDDLARVWSATHSHGSAILEYRVGKEGQRKSWLDYVQGVTFALQRAGHTLGGFDARITSDVPTGSGLSSSAALEVSLARALRSVFDLTIDDVEIAQICQAAENDFVGARVGIMDQMAASLADAASALFIDTRSLAHRRIPLPTQLELIVIHSGIRHNHASGDYNRRRSECEAAAELLGVSLLRECSEEDLPRIESLPEPLARRARHVVTENQRVLDAVEALERNELERLGQLFNASHASMRDDYEVSIPAVDALVGIAQADTDIYGARLTGGGFGGSIVALSAPSVAAHAATRIAEAYRKREGQEPLVLVPANQED